MLNGYYAEIFSEDIKDQEIKNEYIMLALRTSDGISLSDYKNTFNSDFLSEYKEEVGLQRDYLDIDEFSVRIKEDYLYVQNHIIINFLK